jgi:hypothetical protein
LKKPLAICAGLWLLGFGAAGTATAQTIYGSPELADPALPPYEIMSIVRSTGLTPLTRPMRRGPYYVLVAVDRVGRQMRVVVDAQLGDIVNLRPALAAGSYGPEVGRPAAMPSVAALPADVGAAAPSYGPRPGGENALPPTPPRPIPGARTVNAAPPAIPPPSRVAVAEPPSPPPPPLPRPRPKLALIDAPAQSPVQAPAQTAAPAPAETKAGPPAEMPPAPPAAAPPAPSGAGETSRPIE